jgi:RecB family exonuclease
MGAVLEMIGESSSGPAADTGSAVHCAAKAFHETKGDFAAAMKAMRDSLPEYPLADLGSAELQFRHYSRDPRNAEARVVLRETKVRIVLPPPEGDSTETPVIITGQLDQVREKDGVLTLYDIKTGGSQEGSEMLSTYFAQLAAYQVGASLLLGRPVVSAGIIRTKDYLKTDRKKSPKPGPVFWEGAWTLADAREILDEVRRIVGDIRSGRIRVSPSADNCQYCPAVGVANCLARRKSLIA